jgi:hypothetical protein
VQGETIVGEICHIKAKSKEGPRHGRSQTPEERHDYDNLILMCGNHHTVIDDDPDAYTVDRLFRMKRDHESVTTEMSTQLLDAGTRLLVDLAITSLNQSGGITAHTVNIGTPGVTGPRLGSRVRIDRLGEREHVRFSLVTTLYNHGHAPALTVDGTWRLNVSQGIPAERTIRLDSLPPTMPYVVEHDIGGPINNPFFSNPSVRGSVQIRVAYADGANTPYTYYADYEYDLSQKAFILRK